MTDWSYHEAVAHRIAEVLDESPPRYTPGLLPGIQTRADMRRVFDAVWARTQDVSDQLFLAEQVERLRKLHQGEGT